MNGIKKKIKDAGRAEVNHTPVIPDEPQAAIHKLLGNLLTVMKNRKNGDPTSYEESLKLLPNEYKHNYHELLVAAVQYIVTNFDLQRGREGIEKLTKSHFVQVEENGVKFFRKVCISHTRRRWSGSIIGILSSRTQSIFQI